MLASFLMICSILANMMMLTPHPLHISITNIEINSSGKKGAIEMKMFKHDLEKSASSFHEKSIFIDSLKQEEETIEYIDLYIQSVFKMYQGSKKMEIELVSDIKTDMESVYLSYRVADINTKDSLVVINSMLIDVFPDQKNLVFVSFNDESEGLIFEHDKLKQIVDFKK